MFKEKLRLPDKSSTVRRYVMTEIFKLVF